MMILGLVLLMMSMTELSSVNDSLIVLNDMVGKLLSYLEPIYIDLAFNGWNTIGFIL